MRFLLFVLLLHTSLVHAQLADKYSPKLTRILFLLDGSGSMKEEMDKSNKFEVSKKIIANYLDSLARINIKVETAVRLFGHLYPPSVKNCKDSRLEIPFGKHTAAEIKSKLDLINPKGWTPISYSLEQAIEDFPDDPSVKNAIVLISDGLETCGGDICAVAQIFQQRKIALKPYVIGLGLPEDKQHSFDCVGKYYDAANSIAFDTAMRAIITQALNPTTVQINLMNEFGKPSETNIEISLYDSYSGGMLYNFVHALDETGVSDTLKLNPSGKYDIKVHSFPPVAKKGVELVAGTHNVIGIDVPQGSLKLTELGTYKRQTPLQCLVFANGKSEILMIQDFGSTRKYLTGSYNLEILTLPRMTFKDVKILQGVTKEITVQSPGALKIVSMSDGIASVYIEGDNGSERIHEYKGLRGKEALLLQPGKYMLVYRLNTNKAASSTRTQNFEIISELPITLNL